MDRPAVVRRAIARIVMCACACGIASASANAETIKIGLLKVSGSGPLMIAQEKGYFAKEGLTADLFFPDQPPLILQGILGSELAFGIGAPTAGFYNAAGQGALHVIAGNTDEVPGFKGFVAVVSNQAYASGVKTFDDLGGHSFAIIAAGTPQQYVLGLVAQKHGFDYASVRMMPLGSFPNMVSAVVGGSADSAFPPLSAARQALADEKLHSLGWISDELRMTIQVVMTSAAIANGNPELVNRFLRVYRAGLRDYHDAFTGPDERPLEGPGAAEDYAIMAKYLGSPIDLLKLGIGHLDAEGRVDVDDIVRQIAWYKSQGMVKAEVDGARIIDSRYIVPMPQK